jgi:hypothetical protein
MPNALVEEHIKQFAKDNNVSYGCALSMTECKVSYKKKNLCTTYDKPIGPVKYRKPHTMYDRVIGPVKPYPLQVFKKDKDKKGEIENAAFGNSKHKSYYREMRKAAPMQHGKEAYKKLDNFLT